MRGYRRSSTAVRTIADPGLLWRPGRARPVAVLRFVGFSASKRIFARLAVQRECASAWFHLNVAPLAPTTMTLFVEFE